MKYVGTPERVSACSLSATTDYIGAFFSDTLDVSNLLAQVKAMAEAYGECVGAYVATSASRFSALAGDEALLSLIAQMEKASEPGQTALQCMLRWALEEDRKAQQCEDATAFQPHTCSCGAQH